MTGFNNGDLYNMLLDRLRKDRKGSVTPEEFESFLKWRNVDYFNKMLETVEGSHRSQRALSPFCYYDDVIALSASLGQTVIDVDVWETGDPDTPLTQLAWRPSYILNIWYSDSATDLSSKIKFDIVNQLEYAERKNNAITAPSATNPVICELGTSDQGGPRYLVGGVTTGYAVFDYYMNPEDPYGLAPYFDYYTDAYGNVTYLEENETYALAAGEVSRSGAKSGNVNSLSIDLLWRDHDAMNILDMIVSDVSIALSDSDSFQASLLERQQNASV